MTHGLSYDSANWDNIKAFLALYRAQDYQEAAEVLGIDDSTLRRKVQSLEGSLGHSLFVRENSRWTLAPGMEPMLDAALAIEKSTRLFFGMTPSDKGGVIKISLPHALISHYSSVLISFSDLYPKFTFNISSDARFVDLEREGFDFAIRLARPIANMNSLKIKRLGAFGLGVYASIAYIERVIQAYGTNSLFKHADLIETGIGFSYKSHEFVFGTLSWTQLGFSGKVKLVCDDLESCALFCSQEGGLAILPNFLARRYPNLICINDVSETIVSELWLVSRLDMKSKWQVHLADMLSVKSKELELINN